MARKPKQKPQPEPAKNNFEEGGAFDSDAGEEDVGNIEATPPPAEKSRDWRDVEKFKEMRYLKRLVDDDLDFDDEPGFRRRT